MSIDNPAETFHRQRRNLLIVSALTMIIYFGKAPLSQLTLFGNKFPFENVSFVNSLPLIFVIYWSIRYIQSFNAFGKGQLDMFIEQRLSKEIEIYFNKSLDTKKIKKIFTTSSATKNISQEMEDQVIKVASLNLQKLGGSRYLVHYKLNYFYMVVTSNDGNTKVPRQNVDVDYAESIDGKVYNELKRKSWKYIMIHELGATEFYLPIFVGISALICAILYMFDTTCLL